MLVSPAMRVRPTKGGGSRPKPPSSEVATLPAPLRGWITAENLTAPRPGGADVFWNWIPTLRGARPRGGALQWAYVTDACTALMAYRSGTAASIFAATANAIYNVTSPASPTVAPTADVTGLSGGDWSHINFTTSGGSYLVAVNGLDQRRLFDGATWATTPSMTGGPGTNGNLFSHVWVYKYRIYFVKKDSLSVWYLPVDSVGGALTEFPMTGLFQNGGEILFGATWSTDGGSGLSDNWVVATNQGEVAIFQGGYPGDAEWTLVGRYDIGRPLGKNAIMRAGGDLLVATTEGLPSLNKAISSDRASLTIDSVSAPIQDQWQYYAANRSTAVWSITKWPAKGYALVGISTSGAQDKVAFTVNLSTGAWGPISGWDVACAIEAGDKMYFGGANGKIFRAEEGGADGSDLYQCTYIGLPENFGALATNKTALMMRATFIHTTEIIANVGVATDYSREVGVYPSSPTSSQNDVWDTGLWDVAKWDAGGSRTIKTDWVSVTGSGNTLAPVIQMTFGTTQAPDIELVNIELLYQPGEIIV